LNIRTKALKQKLKSNNVKNRQINSKLERKNKNPRGL